MANDSFFAAYVPSLEEEMRTIVRSDDPGNAVFYGMLRYHLGWADAEFKPTPASTGKRIRPVLCLLACEACGGDWVAALPAAAAIELLHNFSLVHDDIEDRDEIRRGRPTLWSLWGEAQAINAGDALLALSQLALLRLMAQQIPATTILAACELFNRTCLTLTEGQHLDIGFETRVSVPVADYLSMIEGKTAALVACACEMGGLIASSSDVRTAPAKNSRRDHLRSFGRHLGLAFQMQDDILGVWGDPGITGKPAGADVVRRKKTLPILHGLERSARLRRLLAKETLTADDIHQATAILGKTDSRAYAEQLARRHHAQALEALQAADLHGSAALALFEMSQMLLNRER